MSADERRHLNESLIAAWTAVDYLPEDHDQWPRLAAVAASFCAYVEGIVFAYRAGAKVNNPPPPDERSHVGSAIYGEPPPDAPEVEPFEGFPGPDVGDVAAPLPRGRFGDA